jgi:xanthine dehydrogenase accessory factor
LRPESLDRRHGEPCILMRDILPPLQDAIESARPFCWCRVVETRGSTPQKAGAAMMVFADGSQAGTLGGGCVEAEVKRRALAVLAGERGEIQQFVLDHDYGWDDGLICGGRMTASLHPVNAEPARAYLRKVTELLAAGEGFTEAIVYDVPGRGLMAADSLLLSSEGQFAAILASDGGGDDARLSVREHLRSVSGRPQPYVANGIAYLPCLKTCRLVIVGGGHVGKAVAELASDIDFDVWVVDDRAEYVAEERFPRASRRITGRFEEILPQLEITPNTYCLIVTRGHNHDERALYHVADRGAAYVGMIGSKRKIRLIFDDLIAEGVPQEVLDRVHTPVGLDIGSRTVPEIAISIAAELIQHRNQSSSA